jgi:hypothetical protein
MRGRPKTTNAENYEQTNTAGVKKTKYVFLKNACGVGYAYMVGDVAELSDEAVKYLSEKQIIERA